MGLNASGADVVTTTYGYDAFGARVYQIASSTATTTYAFKQFSIASTTKGSTRYATTTEYIFNGDTLLSTVDQQFINGSSTGSAKTRYIHPDHLGSTNIVTDDTGAIVQQLDYYPYGVTRISGGQATKRQYVNRFADDTSLDYMNARYYDASRGQFVSEDPTFWALKMNLNDPQSLNSYSYANDNPITKLDADGLAATLAQQIAVLQAQVQILQGIVSLYQGGYTQQASTAFSAYQAAFGGAGSGGSGNAQSTNRQSNGSIQTWRSNSSGGTSQVPNISGSLTRIMETRATNPWINIPPYFYEKVKNKGAWDLKNTPEYNSKTYQMGFIFNGQHVSSDAPGNLQFGYVGAAAVWSTPQILLVGAGAAQQKAGTSLPIYQNQYFHGDDPADQVNILWGINMYYNR
jgi:RHS repeat-associated protein